MPTEMGSDLDTLTRITQRLTILKAQHEAAIAEAMNQPDRNVTAIAQAAGMTRAGVHKLHQRNTEGP